jgi:hypothetical protein
MRKRFRGLGLAVYLGAIGAMVVLLSLILSLSFQQSFFATALEDQMTARNLAEAALQQTMVAVLRSPDQGWGVARGRDETVLIPASSRPGAYGVATFNPQLATEYGVATCWNNLRSSDVIPGSLDREVPVNTVQLVARGVCGRSLKTLEMLFYVPPFPNALASEGPIRSRGGLLVGGVRDPSKFPGSYADLDPEEQRPAHVVSNSKDAAAIDLGPGARIQGNVAAVGGVKLDASVEVSGMVRQFVEPQPLPKLDLKTLFRNLDFQLGSDLLDANSGALNLKWNAHSQEDLTVNGDLHLDGGMLVVGGDLTIRGGIFGQGAIFVQGQTLVQGGASFHSSDQVALVSRHRIVLDGANKRSSFFQGMLYCEEEIVASDVTVLGTVIARGLGGMQLDDVNLINSPVTVGLINGLELRNYSDDDTTHIILRVEERDPRTQKPLSYQVIFSGRSNGPSNPLEPVQWVRYDTSISRPRVQGGLKNYEEIRKFLIQNDEVGLGYAQDGYNLSWLWNNTGGTSFRDKARNPLREYVNRLEGKSPDSQLFYTINLNPNEALGVLESSRVLLWREVPN